MEFCHGVTFKKNTFISLPRLFKVMYMILKTGFLVVIFLLIDFFVLSSYCKSVN